MTLLPDIHIDINALLAAKEEEGGNFIAKAKASNKRRKSNPAITIASVPNGKEGGAMPRTEVDVMPNIASTASPEPAFSRPKPAEFKSIPAAQVLSGTSAAAPVSASASYAGAGAPSEDPEQANDSMSMNLLRSEEFLRNVLKLSQVKFLHAAGISNADQLIRADKSKESSIIQELTRWRRERGFDEIDVSSLVKAILQWTQKVEEELKSAKGRENKRDDMSRTDGGADGKRESNPGADKKPPSPKRKRKRERRTVPKRFQVEKGLDPIEALSKMAKNFLVSEGITTAQQFLSKKTSDLANAYISWRAEQGLTALKGFGAVSIMSGWKGLVRDTCEAVGESELVEMDNTVRNNPKRKPTFTRHNASAGHKKNTVQAQSQKESRGKVNSGIEVIANSEKCFIAHPGVLNGLPSRTFTACSCGKGKFHVCVHFYFYNSFSRCNHQLASTQISSSIANPLLHLGYIHYSSQIRYCMTFSSLSTSRVTLHRRQTGARSWSILLA